MKGVIALLFDDLVTMEVYSGNQRAFCIRTYDRYGASTVTAQANFHLIGRKQTELSLMDQRKSKTET